MNSEDRAMESIHIRHDASKQRVEQLQQEAREEAEIVVKCSDSLYYFANMANLTEAIDNVKDPALLSRLEYLLRFDKSELAELLKKISISYNINQYLGDLQK